jgi:hypothetical protein
MNTVRWWIVDLLLGVAVQAQAGNTGYTPNPAAYPTNDVTDVYAADRRTPHGTNNQFSNFSSPDYNTGNVRLRPSPDVNSTTVENRIILKWSLHASPASIGLLCKGSHSVLCFSFLW